jgi:hypothetical protein
MAAVGPQPEDSTMSRSRRRTIGAAAVVVAAALLPSTATAAPDSSLRGLVLSGEDTCGFKTVHALPLTPNLFGPVQLLDETMEPTGKWLFPYEVTVLSGEGLKARHMLPGETFTRPGGLPTNAVTCDFAGATKEDGPFEVQITGAVRGR